MPNEVMSNDEPQGRALTEPPRPLPPRERHPWLAIVIAGLAGLAAIALVALYVT